MVGINSSVINTRVRFRGGEEAKPNFDRDNSKRILAVAGVGFATGAGIANFPSKDTVKGVRNVFFVLKQEGRKSAEKSLKLLIKETRKNISFKKTMAAGTKFSLYTVGLYAIGKALKGRTSITYEKKQQEEKNFIKTVFEIFLVGMIGAVDSMSANNFTPVENFAKNIKSKYAASFAGKVLSAGLTQFGIKKLDRCLSVLKIPSYSIGTALIASSMAFLIRDEKLPAIERPKSKPHTDFVEDSTKQIITKDTVVADAAEKVPVAKSSSETKAQDAQVTHK